MQADPNISKSNCVHVVAKDAESGTKQEAEKEPCKETREVDQTELEAAQEAAQKELAAAAAKIQALCISKRGSECELCMLSQCKQSISFTRVSCP